MSKTSKFFNLIRAKKRCKKRRFFMSKTSKFFKFIQAKKRCKKRRFFMAKTSKFFKFIQAKKRYKKRRFFMVKTSKFFKFIQAKKRGFLLLIRRHLAAERARSHLSQQLVMVGLPTLSHGRMPGSRGSWWPRDRLQSSLNRKIL